MPGILYDHEFFSVFGYSGITRYFHEIIRRISAEPEFPVSLFMGFHVNEYGLEREAGNLKRFFGMRRPAIPRTRRFFNAINDGLFPLFGRMSRADIYHQTYYSYMYPGFRGKRAVTLYDMTYEIMPQMFPGVSRERSDKRTSAERADGIIAISESTKRDLVSLFKIPESRVRTIYLGNSLTLDPGTAPRVGEPYLLYVGQRVAHKNFGSLARAYAGMPDILRDHKLVCFGGSPFTREETELFQTLGITERVTHMSGSDALLANLYGFARALVYPSFYEGFGLPVLEAMGYGCPVVLSRSSSLPEVAGDAGEYFDPKDPEELAAGLRKVLTDEALRTRLSLRGRERSRLFTWEECARKTMAFYRDLGG